MIQQGAYKWGERDCLSTLAGMVRKWRPDVWERHRAETERFLAMTDVRAWATLLQMGGAAKVYTDRLCPPCLVCEEMRLADVLFYDRPLIIAGNYQFHGMPGGEAMGFRHDGRNWHWTPRGMMEVLASARPSLMLRIRPLTEVRRRNGPRAG